MSVTILGGVLLFFLLGCQEPGTGGIPFEASIPPKQVENGNAVEAICSIDAAAYNPLNIKDYVFTATGDIPEIQFFNYAVLGYGYFTKDPRGYIKIALTPALRYVLDNNITYIKPLRQRGIQVLLEIRSGNFSDDQEGEGVGMGTLDVAAIDELVKEFKLLIDRYGIDGFEFHDIGGGKKAYPPFTRDLKQFQKDAPLYDETLFQDRDGNPLSAEEVNRRLWREGGSNFSNLIQRTNEHLKETFTVSSTNGTLKEDDRTTLTERSLLVRDPGHGGELLAQLRGAYMPDAYSGADAKVSGNLKYIIHGKVYDFQEKPFLWDETQNTDKGAEALNQYAPFGVDLAVPKDRDFVQPDWTKYFTADDSRYGALYFINLPPASESNSASYLSYFSRDLFGRTTSLADGAGDHRKTW